MPDLLRLGDRVGAPIIKTLAGKALFADDHPLTIGGLGLLGTRPAVNAIEGCDILVMAGTDFPYRDFLPDGVPVSTSPSTATNSRSRRRSNARALGFAQAKVKEFFGLGEREGGISVITDVLH